MSSNKIEKLKILEGNDMFPSIRSNEFLLLDKEVIPKIGDVILVENRYGMKIAHRLIHKFGRYYFTRGDNCLVFNFPSRKDKVLGVVVGKYKKVEKNLFLDLFLDLFLIYFIFYNLFFDIKKKKEFLILKVFSKLLGKKNKMEQKNNIESYYSIEDICIKVIHHDDALFNLIDDELKYYKSKEKNNPNGVVALIPSGSKEIFVPDKAIRSTIEEDKKEIYVHDNKGYIMLRNNYVIELDWLNKKVQIKYYGDGIESYPILRGFIKALFANVAEDKGFLYMHAAAVNYNGKIIILTGDSHCGKSSFLLRFIQKGAKIISDDSLLIKDKKIIPFTFKSNVDENFAKRFGIKNEFFDNGKYIETNKNYKNTDFIFFLHIWNNDRSEIKPFEYSKALFNLVQRYRIGEVFLRRSKGFLFKNYSDFLRGAKCFKFYAGNNEEEVKKKIFKFLDEN